MKNDVMPSVIRMENGVLRNLLTEVKETLATDIELPQPAKRKFGIADLWKIRKNAKQAVSRFKG